MKRFALLLLIFISTISTASSQQLKFYMQHHPIIPKNIIINPYTEFSTLIKQSSIDINQPTNYARYIFNEPIELADLKIKNPIFLTLSLFKKQVLLNKIYFDEKVSASWSFYTNNVIAENLTANKEFKFNYARFTENASFYNLKCFQNCLFSSAKFSKFAIFEKSIFTKKSDFDGVVFKGHANFKNSEFDQTASFTNSTFENNAYFDESIFHDGMNLSSSKINGTITFYQSTMQGTLDLTDAKIRSGFVDLSRLEPININKKINIILTGADISKIILPYDYFKLTFANGTSYQDSINTYESLLKQFKDKNLIDNYKNLYIEYNTFKHLYKNKYITNILDKNIWNYGLDKERIFKWVGYIFIFFTIINSIIFKTIIQTCKTIPFLDSINVSKPNEYNAILRFIYFIPYAAIFTMLMFFGQSVKLGVSAAQFEGKNFPLLCYFLLISITGFLSIFALFIIMIH